MGQIEQPWVSVLLLNNIPHTFLQKYCFYTWSSRLTLLLVHQEGHPVCSVFLFYLPADCLPHLNGV